MSEGNSNNKNSSGGKKRYYKKNNRNKNRNNKSANPQNKQKSGDNKPTGKKSPNKSRNNRRPKSLTPARVMQKYDNLLDQHLIARRKFYEMYGRADKKLLTKLENNFNKTLVDLRQYEHGLKDWQQEVLLKKIDGLPKDTFISGTYGQEIISVEFDGTFEDPHLLTTQKAQAWAEDTEESSGSMEDYEKYKASI